jgi:hypothetical protein
VGRLRRTKGGVKLPFTVDHDGYLPIAMDTSGQALQVPAYCGLGRERNRLRAGARCLLGAARVREQVRARGPGRLEPLDRRKDQSNGTITRESTIPRSMWMKRACSC